MSNNVVPPHLAQNTAPAGNQTNTQGNFEQQVIDLKRRQKELDHRERSLNGAMTREQIQAELKKDKASFLKGFGIDLPQSEEEVPDHIREFRELKAQVEKDKRDASEKQFRDSIMARLNEDPDKYELLTRVGAHDELFGEIERLKGLGEEYDPVSIADQIENGLYTRLEDLKSTKKLKPWFEPAPPTTPPVVNRGAPQTHPLDASRTMTSQDRGTQSNSESAPQRPLSRAESLQRIAAKYGNNPTTGQE